MLYIVSQTACLSGDATYCGKVSQGEDTQKTCLPACTVTNDYQFPGGLQKSASKQRIEHHLHVWTYQDALS